MIFIILFREDRPPRQHHAQHTDHHSWNCTMVLCRRQRPTPLVPTFVGDEHFTSPKTQHSLECCVKFFVFCFGPTESLIAFVLAPALSQFHDFAYHNGYDGLNRSTNSIPCFTECAQVRWHNSIAPAITAPHDGRFFSLSSPSRACLARPPPASIVRNRERAEGMGQRGPSVRVDAPTHLLA